MAINDSSDGINNLFLENIATTINKMDGKVENISSKVTHLDTSVQLLKQRIEDLGLTQVKKDLQEIEANIQEVQGLIDERIDKVDLKIASHQTTIDNINSGKSRRDNIIDQLIFWGITIVAVGGFSVYINYQGVQQVEAIKQREEKLQKEVKKLQETIDLLSEPDR